MQASEVRDAAKCHLLLNCLLVWKWLPHGDASVGEPNFQVVVPYVTPPLSLVTTLKGFKKSLRGAFSSQIRFKKKGNLYWQKT